MQVRRSFPTRGALRRPRLRPVDLVVGAGIIGIFYVVVRLAGSMATALPVHSANTISTDPRAPLVRAVYHALSSTKDHTLADRFFLDLLGRGFTEDEARRQLDTAIDWGRYGELFEYDADSGRLRLEEHPPTE